jgi:hypothetical protein
MAKDIIIKPATNTYKPISMGRTGTGIPAPQIAPVTAQNQDDKVILSSDRLRKESDDLKNQANVLTEHANVIQERAVRYFQHRDMVTARLKEKGYSEQQIQKVISLLDQKMAGKIVKADAILGWADKLADRGARLEKLADLLDGAETVGEVIGVSSEMDDLTLESMSAEKNIIGQMSSDEVGQAMPQIARIDSELHQIAGGRTDMLAKIDAHNAALSQTIADKILPPANASEFDYASALKFVDDSNLLKLASLSSSITQAVLDNIEKNAEMNKQADNLAYNKHLKENKDLSVQELKVAIRKATEKISILKHYAEKLATVPEDEKLKILASILEQLNKPKPIINS